MTPVSASAAVRTSPEALADDAAPILRRSRELVAPALARAIGGLHPWVGEMAGYALGYCEVGGAPAVHSPGKGVRQALAVLGAEAVGAPAEAGVPAAVAVELVHTFSLLHDDVMDRDAMRRGRPAVWTAYGTGPAVLAGDALFALAVETLAEAPATAHLAGAVRQLTVALNDLVRGQADDLLFAHRPWTGPEAVSSAEYAAMAEHKTGALLGCAPALGAQLAGAPRHAVVALDRAGRHLGVAFQIVDDLLGIWGDPAITGKPVHSDLRQGKKTFPVLAALNAPGRSALAELLASHVALDDMALRRAATLVEQAGGRAAALCEARRHLAAADALLADLDLAPRPVEDLRTLLASLARRAF